MIAAWVSAGHAAAAQPASAVERTPAAVAAKVKELKLKSSNVLVVDQIGKRVLYAKNEDQVVPIASITKLMTALVLLEADLPPEERIVITREDYDRVKRQPSRLGAGTSISRGDLLKIMLMASENRAAAALARTYPGGTSAFVAAMNRKALELGMSETQFVDSSGLAEENVSTAADLAWLVEAAYREPLIREYTTYRSHTVEMCSAARRREQTSWTMPPSALCRELIEGARCMLRSVPSDRCNPLVGLPVGAGARA